MAQVNRPLRKSPIWPALLSGLVAPGLGQIFNRDYVKGLFLLLASVGSFVWLLKSVIERLLLVLPTDPEVLRKNPEIINIALIKLMNDDPNMFATFQLLIVIVWLYAIVDAYLIARTPRTAHETERPVD